MNKIEITLDEDMSDMLYENYLDKKDEFDSFDEYIKHFEVYINLAMKLENKKGELKDLEKEIKILEEEINIHLNNDNMTA